MDNLTQTCKEAVRASTRLWALTLISVLLVPATVQAEPFVYLTQFLSNSVSVMDVATQAVVATIPVGGKPFAVAITPNGLQSYVTNSSSGTVSVIDTQSYAVVSTITVGASPQGVAITPDGAYAYVTNYASQTVSVINTSLGSVVATIPVGGQPLGIAITPNGAFAYVALPLGTYLRVIRVSSNTVVKSIPVGSWASNIAITPDGEFAYVIQPNGYPEMSVIKTASNTVVASIPVYSWPSGVAITPDGRSAYVCGTGIVFAIDIASNTIVSAIRTGRVAGALAISPDGTSVYATGGDAPGVEIVDVSTNTFASVMNTGNSYGIAFTPGPSGGQSGGGVLWEQQLRLGTDTSPLKVLVDGQQLVVAGHSVFSDTAANFHIDLFVTAYDLSTGTGGLLWSDTIGHDGVWIDGLVMNGQDLFMVWTSRDAAKLNPDRTYLRKYDRLHGTLLWEQEVFGSSSDKWVSPSSLTASGGKIFVSGRTGPFDIYHGSNFNPQAFTRAYNGANGHVIWYNKSPVGSGAGASIAGGNQVFVVLRLGTTQVLRSYNVFTGAKLWERVIDPNKSVGPMKVNGNQLFLAGSTNTGGNYGNDYVVQSDRIDTGALLWENSLKNVGNDSANDLVVAGQKVFVGGTQTNTAGSQDFLVKAHDVLTGRLLWKNLVDKGGSDSVYGMVADSGLGMVFAVGQGGQGGVDPGHALVRAYNMNTGALAWESFDDSNQYASQAVVAGEKLFVVGGNNDAETGYYTGSAFIRAYAAK